MARAREREPAPPGQTVFIVQARGNNLPESALLEIGQTRGNDTLVCAFTDWAAAEAHARELDGAARACANPFERGAPERLSSDGAGCFWDALAALNLSPPERGQEWAAWWEALCAVTTAGQRDVLWDALDNLHHFDVVEVPLEG